MQSGTRIFAPFIFSRMNDMKSWFFFARLEADHEWRDFEYVPRSRPIDRPDR